VTGALPTSDTVLELGDHVQVLAHRHDLDAVSRFFGDVLLAMVDADDGQPRTLCVAPGRTPRAAAVRLILAWSLLASPTFAAAAAVVEAAPRPRPGTLEAVQDFRDVADRVRPALPQVLQA
jgi:hypothetical protein